MNKLNCAALLLATLLAPAACLAATALPGQTIPEMFGVNIHFTGENSRQVGLIADAGFRMIRMDFHWEAVEKTKGVYDFSAYDALMKSLDAKRIKALLILDYSNPLYLKDFAAPNTPETRKAFADFARAAASHFRRRGILWEVWNEPNGGFWGPAPNAADYVALAKETARAVHEADRTAPVLGPALAGPDTVYLESCFRAGLLGDVDGVTIHPYGCFEPEAALPLYEKVRGMMAQYGPKGKAVSLNSGEWGYSMAWVTAEKQAQFIARMMLTNLYAGLRFSIWYDWSNDGPDPKENEHNFGTVYQDLSPKPSYKAMQVITTELAGCKLVGRAKAAADEYLLLFKGKRGFKLAAWTTGKDREATFPVEQVGAVVSMYGIRTSVLPVGGKLTLTLGQSPQYVELGRSATSLSRSLAP